MTGGGGSFRWTVYAPFYDAFVGLPAQRRRSVALLAPAPGERVLVVGAGTGLDLPLFPPGVDVAAVDLTPAMLQRARPRAGGAALAMMDAQRLAVADASFDAVVLHLIVAIVPDPVRCLAEAGRVLRPGGRLAIFDKFAPDEGEVGLLRRAINPVTRWLATDINRHLPSIVAASGLDLEPLWRESAAFGGFLRLAGYRKAAPPGAPQAAP